MTTCFLFLDQITDVEQCFSIRLSQEGHVEAPLEKRSIEAFKALQTNSPTIIVLPTITSTLHDLELPWLGEKKARAAIPFALEEQLAQNVTTLQFSFDHYHYQNNRYLIVVTDKNALIEIMSTLAELKIDYDAITLEWFALEVNEACITAHHLLVNDNTLKGGLNIDVARMYLQQKPDTTIVYTFNDSLAFDDVLLDDVTSFEKIDENSMVWLAKRLLKKQYINLCQDELQHGTRRINNAYWYRISGVLFGIWLASLVLFNAIHLYQLNHQLSNVESKIAGVYFQFFPQAKQVISPEFRINQWLKSNTSSGDEALWKLLSKLATAFDDKQITIQQLRFQNNMLAVTLISNDFAALEKFQLRLQKSQVKVRQANASSQNQHVLATLELS